MGKKCIICDEKAELRIKDSSEFYCKDCATENFSDIEVLQSIEDYARNVKKIIDEKLEEN